MLIHSIPDLSSLEDHNLHQSPETLLSIAFLKFGSLSNDYLDIQCDGKPVWVSVFNSVELNNFVKFTCEIVLQNCNELKGFVNKELLHQCLSNAGNPGVRMMSLYLIFQCYVHSLLRSGFYSSASFGVCSPRIIYMLSYLLLCKLDKIKEVTAILYQHDKTFLRTAIYEIVSYCLAETADIQVSPSFIESHNSCSIKPRTFAQNILTTERQREGDIHYYAYSTAARAARLQHKTNVDDFCYDEIATLGYENYFKYFKPNHNPESTIMNFLKKMYMH